MERDETPLFKGMAPIADALRRGLEVPQDTFITDGFPLLMTKLGFIPASSAGDDVEGVGSTVSSS